MLRTSKLLLNVSRVTSFGGVRFMTHYPIDDGMFGLSEEQSAVSKYIDKKKYPLKHIFFT